MKNKKGQEGMIIGVVLLVVIVAIITLIVLFNGYDTVDASHLGVMNQFGEITGVMQPGIKWTGVFTTVFQYDLRIRQKTIEMISAEQTAIDRDGQSIKARIQINYRLKPESVENAYRNVGQDKDLEVVLNLDGIVREGMKQVTAKYTSTEIWQNRQQVKDDAIKAIENNFPKDYFVLENVIIPDIDFNPAFMAAIEQQKTNEKLALSKEKEVAIAKFEADRIVAETRGLQDSKKIEYEAEAYRILVAAQSEAEALKMKREQITPMMVQMSWIEAWKAGGAQVPKWVMGDKVGSSYMMQMPAADGVTSNQVMG
jgi:regulator of protease activity HflC (stomatin/prohibitin superfamily)